MKKFWVLYFVGVLLLSTRIWAADWDESVRLNTPDEQAEAFLKVKALIPTITEGAVRNGVNPLDLFKSKETIIEMMAQEPSYQQLAPYHQDLIEFAIFPEGETTKSNLDEKSVAWKNEVMRSTSVIQQMGLLERPADLVTAMKEILSSNMLGKTQGITVGLAQILPAEVKKEFFSASLDRKIEIMTQYLPSEIVSAGFAPAKVGWSDTSISKEEIISRIRRSAQADKQMTALLTYHYSIMQSQFSNPKDYVSAWTLEANQKKSLEQAFSIIAKNIPAETKSAEPLLIVREVGPLVGMFRGYAGNDCSTACSFPFVHSPNEYTFIVYDKKGAVKGYAQGTKVTVQKADSFYLHTIAGPRISKEDTLNIIKMFDQEKARMGWSKILFPKKQHIADMVNFVHVRDVMISLMTPETVRLEYQDAKMRALFKTKFSLYKSYDDAATNEYGHILDTSKLGQPMRVTAQLAPAFSSMKTQISKEELFGVIVQLSKEGGKTEKLREALLAKAGLDLKEIQLLITITDNAAKKPTAEFIDGFEKSMQAKGFSYPNGYFKKNIAVLARGLLKSPDLIENDALFDETIRSLIDQRDISTLKGFFETTPKAFLKIKTAETFLVSFFGDIHEAELYEPKVLDVALKTNPQVVLFSEAIMDGAMRSPRSAKKILEFIDANPTWALRLQGKSGGRGILENKQKTLAMLSSIRKEMLEATDERGYLLAAKSGLSDALGSNSYSLTQKHLRTLISTTMEHYLSLNPRDTTKEVRVLFQNQDAYNRSLRQMAQVLMQEKSFWDLEENVRVLSKLRTEHPKDKLGQVMYRGLSDRPGIENLELNRIKELELFPAVKWENLRVPQCRHILLKM